MIQAYPTSVLRNGPSSCHGNEEKRKGLHACFLKTVRGALPNPGSASVTQTFKFRWRLQGVPLFPSWPTQHPSHPSKCVCQG
jgi:hypothetical protein